MSNSYFKFKQFTIEQEGCAMKVGTDGCLLGAWFDTSTGNRILDIGCGTGLISIMAAQRSKAQITGIEIEERASIKAKENAEKSPWGERIEIINIDLKEYATKEKFETIVSNPPFFANSLKCDNDSRTLARHNDSLTPALFFGKAQELLSEKGKISIIIPTDSFNEWECEALFKGFHITRTTKVRTTPRKTAKRILIEFGKEKNTRIDSEIILEDSPGTYSHEAKNLLRDFYLKIE